MSAGATTKATKVAPAAAALAGGARLDDNGSGSSAAGGGAFSEKVLEVSGRTFVVRIQRFGNGVFVSVSDGDPRIGSLAASLVTRAGAVPATTTVIPAPSPDVEFFVKMAAEQASTRTCGIAVVSAHMRGGLADMSVSRALLGEVMEMIRYDGKGRD